MRNGFRIKVTDIFKTEKGQIICSEATELNYMGIVECEGKTYKVLGFPVFVAQDLAKASYLIDSFNLDNSFIGKEFIVKK